LTLFGKHRAGVFRPARLADVEGFIRRTPTHTLPPIAEPTRYVRDSMAATEVENQ